MDLDDGAVDRHGFNFYPDNLLLLKRRENPIQHTGLGPAIHSGVDCMPVSEVFRQSSPFTTVFSHIQYGVKHLKIGDAHIAALTWKTSLDPSILRGC